MEYVASDLEGTLTAGEVWRGISAYLSAHERKNDNRLFMATHLPGAALVKLGVLQKQMYKNVWMVDQTKLLKGYTPDEIEAFSEWIVEHEQWPTRRESVIAELRRHHDEGRTILIASGGYEPIINAFARRLGLTRFRALGSRLEYADGRTTGRLDGPLSIDAVKAERVRECVGNEVLVAAYGDTAADVPMLAQSRNPVAVAPDAALARIAQEKGWRVIPA
jgi:phosphoserine phosphatase